jgi:hypothetical protein
MQLKPLIATFALLVTMSTGGCVVKFPLADNGPSLQSSSDESNSTSDMSGDSTEPNTNNTVKGNTADTPQQARTS